MHRVLLSVCWDREWHWSTNDVWDCGSTPNIMFINKISFCTSCTKVASKIIAEIHKILTPYLHHSITISWTISRINAFNYKRCIVPIRRWRVYIIKFSSQRNCKSDQIRASNFWWRFALNTSCLFIWHISCFIFIVEWVWS